MEPMTIAAAALAALVALATFAALRHLRVQHYSWISEEIMYQIGVDPSRYDRDAMLMVVYAPVKLLDRLGEPIKYLTKLQQASNKFFWVISWVPSWRSVRQQPMVVDWKLVKESS